MYISLHAGKCHIFTRISKLGDERGGGGADAPQTYCPHALRSGIYGQNVSGQYFNKLVALYIPQRQLTWALTECYICRLNMVIRNKRQEDTTQY